jgi:hypothetical protein
VVETGGLELEVGLEDVEAAVEVVVADADAHTGHLLAVGLMATPLSRPSSRKVPSWLFMKSRLGVVSQATKMSGQPSFVHVEGDGGQAVGAANGGDA